MLPPACTAVLERAFHPAGHWRRGPSRSPRRWEIRLSQAVLAYSPLQASPPGGGRFPACSHPKLPSHRLAIPAPLAPQARRARCSIRLFQARPGTGALAWRSEVRAPGIVQPRWSAPEESSGKHGPEGGPAELSTARACTQRAISGRHGALTKQQPLKPVAPRSLTNGHHLGDDVSAGKAGGYQGSPDAPRERQCWRAEGRQIGRSAGRLSQHRSRSFSAKSAKSGSQGEGDRCCSNCPERPDSRCWPGVRCGLCTEGQLEPLKGPVAVSVPAGSAEAGTIAPGQRLPWLKVSKPSYP